MANFFDQFDAPAPAPRPAATTAPTPAGAESAPPAELSVNPGLEKGKGARVAPASSSATGGNFFDQFDAKPAPPKSGGDRENAVGYVDTIGRGLADMMSFGMADEIAAGGDALFNPVFGTGDDGSSLSERYAKNLNRQRGIDEQDERERPLLRLAGQVGGGVTGGVGLAKSGLSVAARAAQAAPKGWMGAMLRLGGGAADGGIQAGLYGAGSADGDIRDRYEGAVTAAPMGAAFGIAGEGLAAAVGAGLSRAFRGSSAVAPGVDAAANVAQAAEHGVPLSRAQATRSVPQVALEGRLRAKGRMADFDATQADAIASATGRMRDSMAGEGARIANPAEAYDMAQAALRQKRDALKASSQEAYGRSIDNPEVMVPGSAVAEIPNFIQNRLARENIVLEPSYHVGATKAVKFVDDYIGRMPKPDDGTVSAQLKWVENLRSGLRKNFPAIGQDAPAIREINNSLDDWTDAVFDNGMVTGSDDVLADLKQARGDWAKYKTMVSPKAKTGDRVNPTYAAQAKVRDIMEKDMAPEEIGRYLFGSSVAEPKSMSWMTARELKKHLGADSEAWNGIRQAFWLRATRAGDEALDPSKVTKNLKGFLNENKTVAAELYSEAEIKAMKGFAGVMDNISFAGKSPGFTDRVMPTLAKYGQEIMGALGGGAGLMSGLDPLTSAGVGMATRTAAGVGSAVRDRALANAAANVPVPMVSTGAAGGATRGGLVTVEGQRREPLRLTVRPRR